MRELICTVVTAPLAEDDGGGFAATVPDLPGCMSDGETPEEALANVRDAIETWIAMAQKHGQAVPEPSHGFARAS